MRRAPGRSSGCRCRSSRPGCRRRCTAPSAPRSRRPTRRPAARRRRCRDGGRTAAGASVGEVGDRRVERDEEVVAEPWCLVRVTCFIVVEQSRRCTTAGRLGDRIGLDVDPAYARVAAEPPLLAHGELAGARDDRRSTAASSVQRAVEVVDAAPCSRAPGGRCATSAARRSSAATSSTSPAAIIACTRCSMRVGQHVAVPAQADLRDGDRRVDVEARAERAERAPAADRTPRARARRGGCCVGSIRAAATGSSVGQPGVQRGRPDAAASLVELGAARRATPRAGRGRRSPPGGTGRCRRRGARRCRVGDVGERVAVRALGTRRR